MKNTFKNTIIFTFTILTILLFSACQPKMKPLSELQTSMQEQGLNGEYTLHNSIVEKALLRNFEIAEALEYKEKDIFIIVVRSLNNADPETLKQGLENILTAFSKQDGNSKPVKIEDNILLIRDQYLFLVVSGSNVNKIQKTRSVFTAFAPKPK